MIGSIPSVFLPPNMAPIVLGTRLKNAPHPKPFSTMNMDSTAVVLEKGQITSALSPASVSERIRLLIGPKTESDKKPASTRPTVEATFQMANMMTAIFCEWVTDRAKIGIKYGGTKRGKQASPVPTNKIRNSFSRKRYLESSQCQNLPMVRLYNGQFSPLWAWD
ncbi:unnamed protein product [Aspergillus oryzae]|uniref:Unnamed protein product n=2 Tax=Aspergillus oryzae TaxID=5062 RepID=A0AAN4YTY3_ASPOZ|nr:unnamed protein product [Aspergillus oryzae]GMF95910.1 unnamed protein product [Aspergillus oryzae]GMG13872.1 unnamed protein product [Aspergillus oryzae]GMG33082.1 unnamed protein product [Aspergillus oryzae]GMG54460.1 unnamed protein product [Aspergillus oryzae var. brunneus]